MRKGLAENFLKSLFRVEQTKEPKVLKFPAHEKLKLDVFLTMEAMWQSKGSAQQQFGFSACDGMRRGDSEVMNTKMREESFD